MCLFKGLRIKSQFCFFPLPPPPTVSPGKRKYRRANLFACHNSSQNSFFFFTATPLFVPILQYTPKAVVEVVWPRSVDRAFRIPGSTWICHYTWLLTRWSPPAPQNRGQLLGLAPPPPPQLSQLQSRHPQEEKPALEVWTALAGAG